jgi:hypothetical protein
MSPRHGGVCFLSLEPEHEAPVTSDRKTQIMPRFGIGAVVTAFAPLVFRRNSCVSVSNCPLRRIASANQGINGGCLTKMALGEGQVWDKKYDARRTLNNGLGSRSLTERS